MKNTFSYRKIGKNLAAVAVATLAVGLLTSAAQANTKTSQQHTIQIAKGQTTYTLKRGDTLWSVYRSTGVTVQDLARYNNIDLSRGEERKLRVGQVIYLVPKQTTKTKQAQSPSATQKQTQKVPSIVGSGTKATTKSSASSSKTASTTPSSDTPGTSKSFTSNSAVADTKSSSVIAKNTEVAKTSNSSTNTAVNVVGKGTTWNQFTTNQKVLNQQVGHIEIRNQAELESYLLKTGLDLSGDRIWFYNEDAIIFPTGIYTVDGGKTLEFKFAATKGDVDFNGSTFLIGDGGIYAQSVGNQGGRTVSNLTVYGSSGVEKGYTVGSTYKNPNTGKGHGGDVNVSMLHTTNMNFENLEINNAQNVGGHVFDVVGSSNISFDNLAIRGSALPKNFTQADLKKLGESDYWHSIYSESVQIDASYYGSLGKKDLFNKGTTVKNLWEGQSYTGESSKNISITNSEFTSYEGNTGYGMIHGIDQSVATYGASIGGHSAGKDAYTGIVIDNVKMEGTVAIEDSKMNEFAPIHFLTVESEALGLYGQEKVDYISSSEVRNNTDISVTNVEYVNTKTTNYWNESGQRNDNSGWLAFYEN